MPSRFLTLDYTHSLAEIVGRNHGVAPGGLKRRARQLAESCDLWAPGERRFAFARLPYGDHDPLEPIFDTLQRKRRFRHLVVAGMGGSTLGLRALKSALPDSFRKNVTVVDNIDPETLERLSRKLNYKTTLFNFISKSATTPETLAHYLYFRREMERGLGRFEPDHVVLTLGSSPSDLESACTGATLLSIPYDVGGRFSVLTAVGLFPAAWAGVPVARVMAGARSMAAYLRKTPPDRNPLYLSAALLGLLCDKGKQIQVMMPYADRLVDFAHWTAQLWAESLGKAKTRRGKTVHTGQTPVVARGASDQHSQLQLWVEGPKDKVVSFFQLEKQSGAASLSPKGKKYDTMAYLSGKSMGELFDAEAFATSLSLADQNCPNLTYFIPELNLETLGALFYFFECQTALAGEYFDVNAFNQPGVEAGKRATFALMGRRGFSKEARDFRRRKLNRHRA